MPDQPALLARMKAAYSVWITTVRDDGMPQPTPVWFIVEEDSFLIYTTPDAQKIRNIEKNNKVALSIEGDIAANSYVVVMGEANIDRKVQRVDQNMPYVAKYREGITGINLTPESMGKTFSVGIWVKPLHVRGE